MHKIGFSGTRSQARTRDDAMIAIIRAIGLNDYRRLVDALGGIVVCVPKSSSKLPANHQLVAAIGMESARKLCLLFAGEKIYIRNTRRVSHEGDFLEAVNAGKSNFEISRDFRVSERWVRKVLSSIGVKNPNRRKLDGLPAVSNGGLTGLAQISGTPAHPANENRVSGA